MSEEVLKSTALARFVVETPSEAIPRAMVDKAVRHTLDSIGAGVAGAVSVEAQRLTAVLREEGEGSGKATLWGQGATMTPLNAVLVNGTASHAFELDDTGGCDHSGAVVVPAALAAVEMADRPITGRELLDAIIIGYDVARRPLEACGAYEPHNGAGFHSTGTCGTFGAAAAAARLLGLDVTATQNALGLASSFSSGLWCCVHDGAQSKRLHAGHAAYGGLMSAVLARRGFTGPGKVFEEVWGGFNHSFAPTSSDPDAYLRELGDNWKLARVSIKPHASCRSTHAAIDAVDNLRARHGFSAEDVEDILVRINPFVFGMCGHSARHPMNSAQLSIPYSVAADLVFGSAGLPSFARSRRDDPRVIDMMARIHFEVDHTQKDDDEPTVRVTLKDGQSWEEHVPMPLGAPTNPVTDEALLKKFCGVVGMVFDEATTKELADVLKALESVENVKRDVISILGRTPKTHEPFDA